MKQVVHCLAMFGLLILLAGCGGSGGSGGTTEEDNPPKVSLNYLNPQQVMQGDTLTFEASGSDDGGAVTYLWSDGSSQSSTSITFEQPGIVTVSVEVSDSAGQTATASVQVTVVENNSTAPDFSLLPAGPLTVEEGVKQSFSVQLSSDSNVSYLWEPNGATTAYTSMSFDEPGSVTVSVTVSNEANQSTTKKVLVEVKPAAQETKPTEEPTQDAQPTVTISPSVSIELEKGASQTFTAAANDDGQIVSYVWSDGSQGSSLTKTFEQPGTFSVSVTVTDDAGNTGKDSVSVKVNDITQNQAPTVSISPASSITLQTGEEISLTANASDDNGVVSYLWSHGATTSSSAPISFATKGQYTVSVTVTDAEGLTASDAVVVNVDDANTAPLVAVSPAGPISLELGDKQTFSAQASDDGSIASYLWSNGATTADTEITFDVEGSELVSVLVTDDMGLSTEVEVAVTVTKPEESGLIIYMDASDFNSAPTIWAWIENGSSISKEMGYSWDEQQKMTLDPDSGYYYWQLDAKYLVEVESGLNFGFKINETDEFIRNKTGCYSNNRWFNSLDECLNPPFMPYIGPYLTLITPEFEDDNNTATVLDPATHMVVNYELDSVPKGFVAKVYYRKAGESEWLQQVEDASQNMSVEMGTIHHITLKDLTPNTQYEYKVTGTNGEFSPKYHFTTAKTSMDYSRFLVVGDMQDEQAAQRWHDVAQVISRDYIDEFDFIITVGDMVKDDMSHNGDRFHWWKVFFDKGQDLFAYKPIMPAMGNHDTPVNFSAFANENCSKGSGEFPVYCSNAQNSESFRKYFYINPDMSYPDYYSFSYGNACFLSVNSEIPVFYGRYPELDGGNNAQRQATWLDDKVKQNKSCGWSFAYWHVPPINPAGGKDEVGFLRPYVDSFNSTVDWIITGHVHEYQRLKPVHATANNLDFKKQYGRSDNDGVGYLIAAPAGQWPRNYYGSDMEQLAFYPNHPKTEVGYEIGFTIIQLDGNQFDMKTYGMGGVGDRVQPPGYRPGDDRSLQLLDPVSYSK